MSDRPLPTRRALLALGAASGALALSPSLRAGGLDEYGLDEVSRRVPKHGRVQCPDIETKKYRGTHIRYAQGAKIFVGFQERLEKFEQVAREVGTEVYGRPPTRVVHMGTYNCRRISAYPGWISEHGLGNAIDVEGFNFAGLERGASLPDGVPSAFKGHFTVRVLRDWKAKRGPAKLHARFLHTLARRLIARKDIFRVLLGPSFPGHHNHFHFDCAPYRLVDIFDEAVERKSED
jgi:hypothetical protein